MAYTPDGQTIKVSFDNRAEAVAAYIRDEIDYIFVGDLLYVKDVGGTALPTNGNTVNWSPPPSHITPQHWIENTTPGTTDMTSAILSACTFASAISDSAGARSQRPEVNMRGERMGISETDVTYGGVLVTDLNGFTLRNGQLEAIGTWTATGADQALLYLRGNAALLTHVTVKDITFECDRKTGAITFDNCRSCAGSDIVGHGFIKHGLSSITKNSSFYGHNIDMQEWLITDSGSDIQSNRVASGFKWETADGKLVNCKAQLCNKNFERSDIGYNCMLVNCHFWNGYAQGGTEDPETIYNMYIDEPKNLLISNLYADTGVLYINADALDSGVGDFLSITGAMHVRLGTGVIGAGPQIIIHTTTANNDLAGLHLISNLFNEQADNIKFTTAGSGSWATNLKWTFWDCVQFDGTDVTQTGYPTTGTTTALPQSMAGRLRIDSNNALTIGRSGDAIVQATSSLDLDADYGSTSAAANREVRLGNRGTSHLVVRSDGTLYAPSLSTYADNAAAVTGGLAVGEIYQTSAGALRIRV